jgi:hypothetical protein
MARNFSIESIQQEFDTLKGIANIQALKSRAESFYTNFTKEYGNNYRPGPGGTMAKIISEEQLKLETTVQIKLIKNDLSRFAKESKSLLQQEEQKNVGDDYLLIEGDRIHYGITYLVEQLENLKQMLEKQQVSISEIKEFIEKVIKADRLRKGQSAYEKLFKEVDYISKRASSLRVRIVNAIGESKDAEEKNILGGYLEKTTEYVQQTAEDSELMRTMTNTVKQSELYKQSVLDEQKQATERAAQVNETLELVNKLLKIANKDLTDTGRVVNSIKTYRSTQQRREEDRKLTKKAILEEAAGGKVRLGSSVRTLGVFNAKEAALSAVGCKDGINVLVFDLVKGKMRLPSTVHPYTPGATNLDIQKAVGVEFSNLKLSPLDLSKKPPYTSSCFGVKIDASKHKSLQPTERERAREIEYLKGFVQASLTEMQKLVYHLFHPMAYDMNCLFVHSAGSGKSWLLALLGSTMGIGDYNILFVTKQSISKEIYDAILYHGADFNVQNFVIGHDGTLSKRFVRVEKTPDCANGVEIESVEQKLELQTEEDEDDDEDAKENRANKLLGKESVRISKSEYVAGLQQALGVNWLTLGDGASRKIRDHDSLGTLLGKSESSAAGGSQSTYGFKELKERYDSMNREFLPSDPLRRTAILIDEAHEYVSGEFTKHYEGLFKWIRASFAANKADPKNYPRVFLFTATPYPDHPVQLALLLNLLVPAEYGWEEPGEPPLWNATDQKGMNQRFMAKFTVGNTGRLTENAIKRFERLSRGHLSYYDSATDHTLFPSKNFLYVSRYDQDEIDSIPALSKQKRTPEGLSLTENGPPTDPNFHPVQLTDVQTKQITQCLRVAKNTNDAMSKSDKTDASRTHDSRGTASRGKGSTACGSNPIQTVLQRMMVAQDLNTRYLKHSAPLLHSLVENVIRINQDARLRRPGGRTTEKQYIYVDEKKTKKFVNVVATALVNHSKELKVINDENGVLTNPGKTGIGIIAYYGVKEYMDKIISFDSADLSKQWLKPAFEGKCQTTMAELLRGLYNSEENKGGAIASIFINTSPYKTGMSLKDTLHIHLLPMVSKSDRYQAEMRPIRYCSHKRLRDIYDRNAGRWPVNIYIYEPEWPESAAGDAARDEFNDMSPLEATRSIAAAGDPVEVTINELNKLVPRLAVDRALTKPYHESIQQFYDFNSVADLPTGFAFDDIALVSTVFSDGEHRRAAPRKTDTNLPPKQRSRVRRDENRGDDDDYSSMITNE